MNWTGFEIQGDSMSPTISNGDLVYCFPLKFKHKIKDNELYAIIDYDGNTYIKRLQNIYDKNRRVIAFKLISDNAYEHDSFSMPTYDVQQLLKVVHTSKNVDTKYKVLENLN